MQFFLLPFIHSLTQKVQVSLASAFITHNLAERGYKQKKDGSGADMLREKEGLKDLMAVKETRKVCPACKKAR